MKKITLTCCFLIPLCLGTLSALDREIVLGREDHWRDVSAIENLTMLTGRWGSYDLMLKQAEYAADGRTDLLVHFNNLPFQDHLNHYQVRAEDVLLSQRVVALGESSGGFNGSSRGLHLVPKPGALLYRGTWIGDFSIEFWLYPALLRDGEQVFLWQGARWNGDSVVPQELRCTVQDRGLAWAFENFFTGPIGQTTSIRFRGATSLVPEDWHHHLLRYDSKMGMLEYLVDGIPEAILYATDSGREQGSILLPFAGGAGPGLVKVGDRFTGFLDELRISRYFVESPNLNRYSSDIGYFVSRTFDLGYTGTTLKRIEGVYRTPGDTALYFYYRMTDRADADTSTVPWTQFEAGESLSRAPLGRAPLPDSHGRFLQVMVELYPDGSRRYSPELSELRIVYEQDLPPAPPTGVYAEAGNGRVQLYWNSVNEDDLGGYFVYYGSEPGSYRGTDSDLGPSPIDVGKESQIDVTGLSNSRLYYFSVVAYDATDPPHRSLFSREVSARPSKLLP
ncbi:MAG: hypothetical protein JSV89_10055 [Spirochaetaceae bacterium]|nr:MAG: hypothetical protein JSV89_10055 [Spirochaetaceae bacterium]